MGEGANFQPYLKYIIHCVNTPNGKIAVIEKNYKNPSWFAKSYVGGSKSRPLASSQRACHICSESSVNPDALVWNTSNPAFKC